MLFQCSLRIDDKASEVEIHTALVNAFAQVLKQHQDCPLKAELYEVFGTITEDDGKTHAGKWQIERPSRLF
jgi:hypothetical protein